MFVRCLSTYPSRLVAIVTFFLEDFRGDAGGDNKVVVYSAKSTLRFIISN